ncbi:LmeA family phospholipid-binding protein [Mycolicibacter heraklionensis]|nr:LmeA family phospholipid-binding protein [Mycolicibacter heraklionensis]
MSNPPGPPHGESPWARPADKPETQDGATPSRPPEPSASPTQQMPAGGREEPTTRIPAAPAQPPMPPQAPPPSQAAVPPPTNPVPQPPPAPAGEAPTTVIEAPAAPSRSASVLRDPLALVLILVTVIALALAGVIGAELIARRIGDSKVAKATECVVNDKASASFGVTPPFLWQHITGNYTNISIHTAGNQVKDAKQMTADLSISDVDLHGTGDSRGTIGSLQATLTWPSAGIKETVQNMVPILGNLVSDLKTNAQDGTVELRGAFGLATVVVKPEVVNGGLSLQVQKLTGLGALTLPRESLQPELDRFASELTKRYPLGLRADSIEVTETGVVARFSTRNASIPRTDDPCFAHL